VKKLSNCIQLLRLNGQTLPERVETGIDRFVRRKLRSTRDAVRSGRLTQERARFNAEKEALAYYADLMQAEAKSVMEQAPAVKMSTDRQTETPAFKRWFGDSKVVDAEGKPMVVYHGTGSDISAFDTNPDSEFGSHFGTADQANAMAESRSGYGLPANVMPAFLSLKNPVRLIDEGTFNPVSVSRQLIAKGIVTAAEVAAINDQDVPPMFRRTGALNAAKLRDLLVGKGYDGVVYLNRGEGFEPNGREDAISDALSDAQFLAAIPEAKDSYIAFRPEQIKSATGNDGNFDGANPDIRRSTERDEDGNETLRSSPGVNARRLAELLGAKLYGSMGNIQNVTVKEIFQNSFDAVKGMRQRAGRKGMIRFDVRGIDRTIRVTDNGSGMTPQVLGKEFLQVAGTKKETDRASGGLGIAKMLFIYGNKDIKVQTWRDGTLSTLTSTGNDLMNAMDDNTIAPNIEINRDVTFDDLERLAPGLHKSLGPGDESGTTVLVSIPETYVDPDGDTHTISFHEYVVPEAVLNSPLFEDIEVTWNDGPVQVGSAFPTYKYTPFADVKFKWGSARIYVSSEPYEFGSLSVLSNGIYQFSDKISKDPRNPYSSPIDREIFIDISPSVTPEQVGYPFEMNRQRFTSQMDAAFSQLKNYLWLAYRKDELSAGVENFGAYSYVDIDGGATPEVEIAPKPIEGGLPQKIETGTQIEVRDGRFIVDGKELPILTPDDLKNAAIDYNGFKIDQSEIDPDRPILHDNVTVEIDGERIPVTTALRREFGDIRTNKMFADFGRVMLEMRDYLRNLSADNDRKMGDIGIGVSLDTKYHGVHTYLPFQMATVNPISFDYMMPVRRVANRIWTTMVHELAHAKVKNHSTDFIAELQNLIGNFLETPQGYDSLLQINEVVTEHLEVLQRGQELFDGQGRHSPQSRGRRLKDSGSGVQPARRAGATGDPRSRAGRESRVRRDARGRFTSEETNNQGVVDGNPQAARTEGAGQEVTSQEGASQTARPETGRGGRADDRGGAAGGRRRRLQVDGAADQRGSERVPGADLGPDDGDGADLAPLLSTPRGLQGALPGTVWHIDDTIPAVTGPSTLVQRWKKKWLDPTIRLLVDRNIDLKRVMQAIDTAGIQILEAFNAYQKETLYHGRVATQVDEFSRGDLKALIKRLGDIKTNLKEFDEFLWFRHARERNDYNARINQLTGEFQDGGSGKTYAEIDAYFKALPAARRAQLESAAVLVDRIAKGTRDLMVASGLETQTTIDAWEAAYKNYVPLMREEAEQPALGLGRGFDVRGRSSRPSFGSDKPVTNPLANLVAQRERTIVRAEKNRIAQALYALAVRAPSPTFWYAIDPSEDPVKIESRLIQLGLSQQEANAVASVPQERFLNSRGQVAYRRNQAALTGDNVLSMRINGENAYVYFSRNDARATQVYTAMKNLDVESLNRFLKFMRVISRWFAQVNTQWNVIFGLVNFTRDVQSAGFNLTTTKLRNDKAAVLRQAPMMIWEIGKVMAARRLGRTYQSRTADLFLRFERAGGKTGYRSMWETPDSRAADLQNQLSVLDGKPWPTTKAGVRFIGGVLSDYNDALENAVRLSAFKVATEKGLSDNEAAVLAKELTVNFNRKGNIGPQMGALYAFFNASAQGTARMLETLSGPAGKKIVLGGIALGVLQSALLAIAGFGEDEPPEFIKAKNLVLPNPLDENKGYVTIPMPLGLHVLPNLGRIAAEWAQGNKRDTSKRIIDMLAMMADAFNPIGNAGVSMQTVAPTAADPMVAIMENMDWQGRPIARKDFNSMKPTPGFTRARDSATGFSTWIAEALNTLSGGTDFKPGAISPTPDQLDYLGGQIGGGVFREFQKVDITARAARTGEDLPWHKVPLVGRFYGNTTSQAAVANRFYENLKEVNLHGAEIKGRRENNEPVTDYIAQNPESRLVGPARAVEKEVRDLRTLKRKMIERKVPESAVKDVDRRITEMMKRFNDRMDAVEAR
jgi:hypothetical protein